MKRILQGCGLLILFTLFATGCQQDQPETAPAELGQVAGDVAMVTATPTTVVFDPQLTLDITEGGPNETVTLDGSDFPPNETIFIYVGDDQPVGQVMSDPDGTFELDIVMPTILAGAGLEQSAADVVLRAQTADGAFDVNVTFSQQYTDAFFTYENESGGFALQLPSSWEISDPLITPLGEMTLLGRAPLVAGDPAVSTILVADASQLTMGDASDLLACGEIGCRERVLFEKTSINDLDARSLRIGGDDIPELEWFFVSNGDRLVYFSIHDPLSLETVRPLVDTFAFIDEGLMDDGDSATAIGTPAAETMAEADTVNLDLAAISWETVDLDVLNLTLEVPAARRVRNNQLLFTGQLDSLLGIAWQKNVDEFVPTSFYDPNAEIVSERPVNLDWAAGTEYQIAIDGDVETHVIVFDADASIAYDFFAVGELSDDDGDLIPILQRVVASAVPLGETVAAVETPDSDSDTEGVAQDSEEETPTATPTVAPTRERPDPLEAGPLQTVINFTLFLLRDELDIDILDYFSEEERATITSIPVMSQKVGLTRSAVAFDAQRVPDQVGVVVEVIYRSISGEEESRWFYLVNEDDRWRIDDIVTPGEEPAPVTAATATPSPESTAEDGDTSDGVEDVEATPTSISEDGEGSSDSP